jgi:hypothetical protein
MSLVPVTVQFEINRPDNLQRVVLTLTGAQENNDSERWTIDFEVWERTDQQEAFQVIGEVSVELDPRDFGATRTMAREGLCTGQRAQALVAADVLKANRLGEATADELHDEVVKIVHAE